MSTAKVVLLKPDPAENTAVVTRYLRAYRTAESIAKFAERVRFGGIFLAGVVFISALVMFQSSPEERLGFPTVFAQLLCGALLLLLASELWGMVFRALARSLEMAIDTAVNCSPLLSNAQRVEIMTVPEQESAA